MFGNLKPQPADKILQLIGQFRADPRSDKIDLGVGVYKYATGLTPVMRAVKTAERQLWETERTKAYTGLAGEPEYNAALADLVLGGTVAADRISSVATPGGTGACRQAFELIRMASPEATVWVSDPTWPNHLSILNYLGMKMRPYRYFDGESRGVDLTAMMADLAGVKAGDVVLLHGCCHNPTGANLTLPEWQAVADHLERTGAVPMIDIAYQGFGDGLDADAEGVRLVAGRLPEVLIAASCSKNFGLYRDRVGSLSIVSSNAKTTGIVRSQAHNLVRTLYSMPPDHGAAVVSNILGDAALRTMWMDELTEMRNRLRNMRTSLVAALQRTAPDRDFSHIAAATGMFCFLGISEQQVEQLKKDRGVYMVGSSRINVAGITPGNVDYLAEAIASVL